MLTYQAEPALKTECILGEGPLWHPSLRKLFWVDIEGMQVHSFDERLRRPQHWYVGKRVGAIAPLHNGNLLLALQGEIAELDLVTGTIQTLLLLESNLPENRCNDGKCDSKGRFWIGTMQVNSKPKEGSLYCIEADLKIKKVLSHLTISNGMGWSLNNNTMYFIDSPEKTVNAFEFDLQSGTMTNGKPIVHTTHKDEVPDGMCVDSKGMLWVAFWGGKRVGRFNPTSGIQLAEIKVPALNVTSCTFGGDDLKTLYITTARKDLTKRDLIQFPFSGSLFACRVENPGLPANYFNYSNTGLK